MNKDNSQPITIDQMMEADPTIEEIFEDLAEHQMKKARAELLGKAEALKEMRIAYEEKARRRRYRKKNAGMIYVANQTRIALVDKEIRAFADAGAAYTQEQRNELLGNHLFTALDYEKALASVEDEDQYLFAIACARIDDWRMLSLAVAREHEALANSLLDEMLRQLACSISVQCLCTLLPEKGKGKEEAKFLSTIGINPTHKDDEERCEMMRMRRGTLRSLLLHIAAYNTVVAALAKELKTPEFETAFSVEFDSILNGIASFNRGAKSFNTLTDCSDEDECSEDSRTMLAPFITPFNIDFLDNPFPPNVTKKMRDALKDMTVFKQTVGPGSLVANLMREYWRQNG